MNTSITSDPTQDARIDRHIYRYVDEDYHDVVETSWNDICVAIIDGSHYLSCACSEEEEDDWSSEIEHAQETKKKFINHFQRWISQNG